MNLEWLTPTVGLVRGPTNTILVRSGERALVVDPGLDRAAADRVGTALAAAGLAPAALLFTHAHADHSGACHYLQRQTGLPVFGPPFETEIAAAPLLEPVFLSCGAEPLPEFRAPFTLAKPVEIAGRLREPVFAWEEFRLEVVPLPGHSPGQVGYDLGQGLLAVGDALLVAAFRQKYPIPFLTDLAKTRASLDALEARTVGLAIPGHGMPLDLEGMCREIEENKALFSEIERRILAFLPRPGTSLDLLAELANSFHLTLNSPVHLALDLTTVNAFLTDLARRGLAAYEVAGNRLLWRLGGG